MRVSAGFVVEPMLTLADVAKSAGVGRQPVIVDVNRLDSAAASTAAFQTMLASLMEEFEQRASRPMAVLLRMANVGVVIRDERGVRVRAPPGVAPLPTLYAPLSTGRIYAAFGPDLVACCRAFNGFR